MNIFKEILNLEYQNMEILNEGGADGHLSHIYDRGDLKFSEIKDIFQQLFTGQLSITEKIDGQNLNITFKDGNIFAARNKTELKNPLSLDGVITKFAGRGEIQKAFVLTMKDLQKALQSLSDEIINKIFNDGKNYISIEIVYPETRNVIYYNNRCIIIFHGLNIFDEKFNLVSQDKKAADLLYNKLQERDALKQNTFEIQKPVILKLKNMKESEQILEIVLNDLDKLVDGVGYKATVSDYVEERLIKYIINMATKIGLNLNRNSNFVKELAARISNVSGKRPTKSDINTYAKQEELNVKDQAYKDFINKLDEDAPDINSRIIQPIEDLTIKAGIMLIQQLQGYIALDPSNAAKKLSQDLDYVITNFNNGNLTLTDDKIKRFKKNLIKLEKYGNTADPTEGLVFIYKNRPLKLTGKFAPINQILGLFKY